MYNSTANELDPHAQGKQGKHVKAGKRKELFLLILDYLLACILSVGVFAC